LSGDRHPWEEVTKYDITLSTENSDTENGPVVHTAQTPSPFDFTDSDIRSDRL
jgi:hypothetical protein